MINKNLMLSIYLIETEFQSNANIHPTRSPLAEQYKRDHEKISLEREKTLANPLEKVYTNTRRT